MELIYTSKRGKQIIFDDFEDNTEEYQSFWAEMCPHCHNKYRGILGKRASHGAMGTCSVKGCENEAEYYVDFAENEVVYSFEDLIGMQVNFTELDEIMVRGGYFSEEELLSGKNLEEIIENGCIYYTQKKKDGEPGKRVEVSFKVIDEVDAKEEFLSATRIWIVDVVCV